MGKLKRDRLPNDVDYNVDGRLVQVQKQAEERQHLRDMKEEEHRIGDTGNKKVGSGDSAISELEKLKMKII